MMLLCLFRKRVYFMKTDARIRYTKMKIREAFFQLLSQKPFIKITVTDLCQLAEINRATFYKHYLDINDLLEKTEDEILKSMRANWKKLAPRNSIQKMESMLLDLQNTKLDPIFYLFKTDPGFAYRISEVICEDTYEQFIQTCNYPPQECRMLNRFLVYGCGSVVRNWLLSDGEQKAHEIAEFLYRLIQKNTT